MSCLHKFHPPQDKGQLQKILHDDFAEKHLLGTSFQKPEKEGLRQE